MVKVVIKVQKRKAKIEIGIGNKLFSLLKMLIIKNTLQIIAFTSEE